MAAVVGDPASDTATLLSSTYVPTDPALRGEFTPERYSATVYTDADGGPAVNSAIAAAVAAGGGTIVISKPITFSTPLSATGLAVPIHFRGVGGAATISGKQSSLTYTGTGSTTAFDCSNSSGLGFSDLFLTYSSGSFTGKLLDLGGGATRDGSLHKLRNMLIRPASTLDSHAALVYLDKSTSIDFDSCVLIGSKALYGKASSGSYSNRVTVRGGYIQGRTVEPIWNPGMTWRFDGVTFEPLTSGLAGAANHDAGVWSDGISFAGCYFGDDSITTAGAWITYTGASCEVSGGSILSVQATGSSMVKPNGTNDGPVSIQGCSTHVATLGYLIDLSAATTPKSVWIEGNSYSNIPTLSVNGVVPGGSSVRAPWAGMVDYTTGTTIRSHYGDVAGRAIDGYRVLGDAQSRLIIASDGKMTWGSGAAVGDCALARTAAGTLKLTGKALIGGYGYSTLAANGAVSIDVSLGNVFVVTLNANATSSTITGNSGSLGQILTISWLQDATGGRTYVWPTVCKFAGGVAPSDTTPSKRTSVTFYTDQTNWYEISRAVAVPSVGTLWSAVAIVLSGRRTPRSARRRPSKACGEVTSWTRCRST